MFGGALLLIVSRANLVAGRAFFCVTPMRELVLNLALTLDPFKLKKGMGKKMVLFSLYDSKGFSFPPRLRLAMLEMVGLGCITTVHGAGTILLAFQLNGPMTRASLGSVL